MKVLLRPLLHLVLVALMAGQPAPVWAGNANSSVEALEFRDTSVGEAIRLIARISGTNILATSEASARKFSMTVNATTVRGVVSAIARVTGLSFSYDDPTNTFTLMTNEQFAGDVVITRDAEMRVFNLQHQNVVTAAKVVQSLFGERVTLNIDTSDPDRLEIPDGSVQGSRSVAGTVRSSGGGSSSRGAGAGQASDAEIEMTAQQMQELVGTDASGRRLALSDVAGRLGLEPPVYITINREHNLLYVRTADRQAMRDIERVIRETDRPTKQVLLEVRVMSLDLADDFRSIFNFGLNEVDTRSYTSASGTTVTGSTGVETGATASPGGGGLFFQYISNNLLMQIEALEANNRAKTLSTPMLAASNNSPARLFVGNEALLARGFSSETTTNESSTSTNTTTEVELREVGQTLDILPRINADDTVTLVIQQENSTVVEDGGSVPVVSDDGSVQSVSVDTINTARVAGTVTTKTGTTIAVGGLIKASSARSNQRTPVLGNLPLIGGAFRSKVTSDDRSELILLITPHIYSGGTEGERLARARLARNARNPDIDNEAFANTPGGVIDVDLLGQEQQYVPLTRYAAAMRHGTMPPSTGAYAGIEAVPLDSGGGERLFAGAEITAEPVQSWKKRNLYVTAVVVTNLAETERPVLLAQLRGDWLAATAEVDKLAPRGKPGSRSYVYLISNRPFDDILSTLTPGGGL